MSSIHPSEDSGLRNLLLDALGSPRSSTQSISMVEAAESFVTDDNPNTQRLNFKAPLELSSTQRIHHQHCMFKDLSRCPSADQLLGTSSRINWDDGTTGERVLRKTCSWEGLPENLERTHLSNLLAEVPRPSGGNWKGLARRMLNRTVKTSRAVENGVELLMQAIEQSPQLPQGWPQRLSQLMQLNIQHGQCSGLAQDFQELCMSELWDMLSYEEVKRIYEKTRELAAKGDCRACHSMLLSVGRALLAKHAEMRNSAMNVDKSVKGAGQLSQDHDNQAPKGDSEQQHLQQSKLHQHTDELAGSDQQNKGQVISIGQQESDVDENGEEGDQESKEYTSLRLTCRVEALQKQCHEGEEDHKNACWPAPRYGLSQHEQQCHRDKDNGNHAQSDQQPKKERIFITSTVPLITEELGTCTPSSRVDKDESADVDSMWMQECKGLLLEMCGTEQADDLCQHLAEILTLTEQTDVLKETVESLPTPVLESLKQFIEDSTNVCPNKAAVIFSALAARLGDDEAVHLYRRALEFDPSCIWAQSGLIRILLEAGHSGGLSVHSCQELVSLLLQQGAFETMAMNWSVVSGQLDPANLSLEETKSLGEALASNGQLNLAASISVAAAVSFEAKGALKHAAQSFALAYKYDDSNCTARSGLHRLGCTHRTTIALEGGMTAVMELLSGDLERNMRDLEMQAIAAQSRVEERIHTLEERCASMESRLTRDMADKQTVMASLERRVKAAEARTKETVSRSRTIVQHTGAATPMHSEFSDKVGMLYADQCEVVAASWAATLSKRQASVEARRHQQQHQALNAQHDLDKLTAELVVLEPQASERRHEASKGQKCLAKLQDRLEAKIKEREAIAVEFRAQLEDLGQDNAEEQLTRVEGNPHAPQKGKLLPKYAELHCECLALEEEKRIAQCLTILSDKAGAETSLKVEQKRAEKQAAFERLQALQFELMSISKTEGMLTKASHRMRADLCSLRSAASWAAHALQGEVSASTLPLLALVHQQGEVLRILMNATTKLEPNLLTYARQSCCSVAALRSVGCDLADLAAAGYSAKELRDASISVAMLRTEGADVGLLYALGYSHKEVAEAGYTWDEIRCGGGSASLLRESGVPVQMAAGLCLAPWELAAAGYSEEELREVGLARLHSSCCNAGWQLDHAAVAFVGYRGLRAAGYTESEILSALGAPVMRVPRKGSSTAWVFEGVPQMRRSGGVLLSEELCFSGAPDKRHRYSFRVRLYTNGSSDEHRGSLSIFFCPRPGADPAGLAWPIRHRIILSVLSKDVGRPGGAVHRKYTLDPARDRGLREYYAARAPPPEADGCGWGHDLLSSEEYETGSYLFDEHLIVMWAELLPPRQGQSG